MRNNMRIAGMAEAFNPLPQAVLKPRAECFEQTSPQTLKEGIVDNLVTLEAFKFT